MVFGRGQRGLLFPPAGEGTAAASLRCLGACMKNKVPDTNTLPLFPEAPAASFGGAPPASLCIAATAQAPLKGDQKTFNGLIRKIDIRRQRLAEWDSAQSRFRREFVDHLLPLQQQEADLRVQLAEALDGSYATKGLTKGERRKLSALVVDLAGEILEHTDHGGIKALYNRHSQSDFDAQEAVRRDGIKSALEEMFGVELGDDVDMGSPEDIFQRVESHYRSQEEQLQARRSKRKKSAKQQASADRREAEEKQLSQSIQTVYRKLASALHPDREPDPEERQRKTALMQRANEAYAKADLLQLLELQLALEQIDAAHLAAIEPPLLKRYIAILKSQLSELDGEIQRTEDEFAAQFGLPPFGRVDPKDLPSLLETSVAACDLRIRQLQDQLEIAGDSPRLKAWLKTITLRRRPPADFDFLL